MSNQVLPGLYVHIPFCKTKCPYCDFYSITDSTGANTFLDAVITEAGLYRDIYQEFDSLYFGGGTPSFVDDKEFARLVSGLQSLFVFSPHTEITVEMNPDDVTREKLSLYKSLGINRISLGVQSFNDKELVFLQRRHTAAGAKEAIHLIQSAGFANFGIDLINSLPGQRAKNWMKTLEEASSFKPAHISCYQLTINGATPFGKMVQEGALKLPSDEKQRNFFLSTSHFLKERGFIHYEISNFAFGEASRSRHNMKYWSHVPYLGLGPGAHSFHNNVRWWNVRSIEQYLKALSIKEMPVEGRERLSSEQLELEKLFLGLRNLEGVEISDTPCESINEVALKRLIAEKLVEIHDGKIIPTTAGYLVADRLPLLISG
ncbi:MAG: coproporphyrinogen III oxidase [Syntrophus sp. (in: bacteria)]|nr:coproporphyrinogen III oxidase [Syntrophus sp. (in: bacteria)]